MGRVKRSSNKLIARFGKSFSARLLSLAAAMAQSARDIGGPASRTRLSTGGPGIAPSALHSLTMIDLTDLRARPDAYQDAARKKRIAVDVGAFLAIDAQRRELLPLVESMRARRNAVSKAVPSMAGEEKQRAIAEMRELASELKRREDELAAGGRPWGAMQLPLPPVPPAQGPGGDGDTDDPDGRDLRARAAF